MKINEIKRKESSKKKTQRKQMKLKKEKLVEGRYKVDVQLL